MECPVDVPETGHSQVKPRVGRATDDYADVPDMFRSLAGLAEHSDAYQRKHEEIVTRCLPLADNVARHFDRRGEDLEDLIQVARVGLLNAVNRFDPEKGASFLGFAVPTMMGEVRRHFRDHGWSLHVPRAIRDRHAQISRATAELTQELQRAPTRRGVGGRVGYRPRRGGGISDCRGRLSASIHRGAPQPRRSGIQASFRSAGE